MALHWQPVVLLLLHLHHGLFVSSTPIASENNAQDWYAKYRPQIWSVIDQLNANPDRQYNYNFNELLDTQKKTDDVTFIELEVAAECFAYAGCPNAIFTCKGYVEYFANTNTFETLPGVDCQLKAQVTEPFLETSTPKEQTNAPSVQKSEYCPGCTVDLDINVPGVENLITTALHHLEAERTKKHVSVRVLRLQREIVSGVKFILWLEIAPTVCDAPVIENPLMCPIDSQAASEICRIEYIQKPWISDDKHIIGNNCTTTQDFAAVSAKKTRNDFDNEIDVNNEYKKSAEIPEAVPESPNYEKMAETGNLEPELSPSRLLDLEAQIIPTNPTQHLSVIPLEVETTKFGMDNSQLAVEDVPSLPTSTDSFVSETSKPIKEEIKDEVSSESLESTESTDISDEERIKRQTTTDASSASSSEESNEAKNEAKPTKATPEKKDDVNEPTATTATDNLAPVTKDEVIPEQTEKTDNLEPAATPVDAVQPVKTETVLERRKRSNDDSSSSDSEEKKKSKHKKYNEENDNNVKTGKKKDSSDSSSSSDEDKTTNRNKRDVNFYKAETQLVDDLAKFAGERRKRSNDDSSDSDSSNSEEKKKSKHKKYNEENDNNVKNGKKKDSSDSSSSSDEDKTTNRNKRDVNFYKAETQLVDDLAKFVGERRKRSNDDSSDSDSSNSEEKKKSKHKKYNEENDNNVKNSKKKDSSDSSSSSDDDKTTNRKTRDVNVYKAEKQLVDNLAKFAGESLDDDKWKHEVLEVIRVKKLELETAVYHMVVRFATTKCNDIGECFPFEHDKLCKLMILRYSNGQAKLLKSRCHQIERDIDKNRSTHRMKRTMIGAPEDALGDPETVTLAKQTLVELDASSKHENKYKIVKILEATKQVVSGLLFKLKVEIVESDCSKLDDTDSSLCGEKKEASSKICHVRILDQSWLPEGTVTNVTCDQEHHTFRSRRSISSHRNTRSLGGFGAPADSTTDPETRSFAKEALLQLDTESQNSNKYKISKIHSATKKVVAVFLYEIHADIIESDCEKSDQKDSDLCGNKENAAAKKCKFVVIDKVGGEGRETEITCDQEEKRTFHTRAVRSVPGAPIDATSDPEMHKIAKQTLIKLDSESTHENKYKVVKIHEASKQVVSGILYKLKVEIIESDCLKNENKDSALCGEKPSAASKICHIKIWDQPWLPHGTQTNVTCDQEHHTFRSKRSINLESVDTPEEVKRTKREAVGAPVDSINDPDIFKKAKESLLVLDSTTNRNNKYKVVKIHEASKQLVAGTLYKIKADVIESDCPKSDSKESDQCGENKDATLQTCMIEILEPFQTSEGKKTSVACGSKQREIRSVTAKGAPVDSTNDPNMLNLAKESLLLLDSKSSRDNKYKVVKIHEASKQVVSGTLYKIKADIIESDCPKSDSKESDLCGEKKEAIVETCKIEIWDQPWLPQGKKTTVSCGDSKHSFKTRRSIRSVTFQTLQSRKVFNKFVKEHNRKYKSPEEEEFRFGIFLENMRKAEELQRNEQGSAVYGASRFADLHPAEFKQYLGYRPELREENNIPHPPAKIPNIDLPTEFDWRTKGAVTHVKDQGQCGSCWAFSVTGNVEGQYAIKHDKLLEFSEQELVDCDKMDEGCNGGLMDNAYRAIEQLGGLELESDYPYDAEDEKCQFKPSKSRVQLSGAVNVSQNEDDMAKFLVKNGPISIAINANAMQLYMGGVSHPLKFLCSPDNLDHGVLIVGYGVHTYKLFNKVLPYWIVKNSWGPKWGEQGYYRVYRGDGTCGVNKMASSAIVE